MRTEFSTYNRLLTNGFTHCNGKCCIKFRSGKQDVTNIIIWQGLYKLRTYYKLEEKASIHTWNKKMV